VNQPPAGTVVRAEGGPAVTAPSWRAEYDLALATTDLAASPTGFIERYVGRQSVEVEVEAAKQIFSAGQARNRLPAAVHRTIPFTHACETIATA
jgi:hypothetical protein